MSQIDEPLGGWEWAILLAAGAVATLGWGLVIGGFFVLVLTAAGGLDRLRGARRGPRLPPRRVRLAHRAAKQVARGNS